MIHLQLTFEMDIYDIHTLSFLILCHELFEFVTFDESQNIQTSASDVSVTDFYLVWSLCNKLSFSVLL